MTEEEIQAMKDENLKLKEKVKSQKEQIENFTTKEETWKADKEKLDGTIKTLKEKNMFYYEKLNFQLEDKTQSNEDGQTKGNNDENVDIDDIIDSLI